MKILIVEDDPFVGDDLKDMLKKLGHHVTTIADSYENALEAIEAAIPDLALLDIELKGEKTGIDLGNQLGQMGIDHIYLSDHQDMTTYIRARATAPLRNLPKPVTANSLRNALDVDLEKRPAPAKSEIYLVPAGEQKKQRIYPEKITYIQADGSSCHIHYTAGEKKTTMSMDLKHLLKQLNWPDVLRIHRSHAINIQHLDSIQGNQVIMPDGKRLDIARAHKEHLERRVKYIKP